MQKRVHWIRGWRLWLLWPLIQLAKLWTASLKVRLLTPKIDTIFQNPQPLMIIFWHNRLFCSAELFRRLCPHRRMSGLVSASKDGAWLSSIFELFGILPIRGSSNYRGTQATKEILKHMRSGGDFAITPDGPRGPRYTIAPGAVHIAQATQAPLMLMSWHYEKAWTLNSWDRFLIPKPFSTIYLSYHYVPNLAILGQDASTITQNIQTILNNLSPETAA